MKTFIIFLVLIIVGAGIWLWREEAAAPTASDETMQKNGDMLRTDAATEVIAEDVAYTESATGYFAHPKGEGVYPGVVMIHEWWGLNDNIKDMARTLAGEGYQVLAVDLYHGEVAGDASRARELVGGLNQDEATKNLRAAAAFLRAHHAPKVASLGWCFGGGQSLQLALSGEPLDATVIYYGQLVDDQNRLASQIHWPVLGIFGDKDTSIPVDKVRAFESALDTSRIKNEIHIYSGVGHAFANPSGANYAPDETKDAWEKTVVFLKNNLQN